MSRFKILVFLLAVGIAGSILAASYWYYTRVLGHDSKVGRQIQQMQSQTTAAPDPGLKRFEWAMELVQKGDFEAGRQALYELVRSFPDTTRGPEARRIIGEINMDMLFSAESNPTRKDYIVQPGDSLGSIARKNQSTIECLMRANGILSPTLQPGDHVFVFPLEFEIVVDVSAKTLTLLRGKRFFKEYEVLEIKLPPGMKIPAEMVVKGKSAWLNGRLAQSDKPEYVLAEKWLAGEKNGFNIRPLPKAKPAALAPAPAKPAALGDKSKKKPPASPSQSDDDFTGLPETGVFLPREDVEELFTIIRTQTSLKVLR